VQHYRRARSYISARDFLSAQNSLTNAIKEAKNIPFPQAEEALAYIQKRAYADEKLKEAQDALQKQNWGEAATLLKHASNLNADYNSVYEGFLSLYKSLTLLEQPYSIFRGDREVMKAVNEALQKTGGEPNLASLREQVIIRRDKYGKENRRWLANVFYYASLVLAGFTSLVFMIGIVARSPQIVFVAIALGLLVFVVLAISAIILIS
jgi:hypothetical protein